MTAFRRIRRAAVLAAAIAGFVPDVALAQLFTVTGYWTGAITCKSFDAGVKTTAKTTPVMTVSQVGTQVGVQLDFGGGNVERYTGLANPDGKKPDTKGEVALIRCGTDDIRGSEASSDELGRFTVATKAPPAVKASFKGTTVVAGAESVSTCTWKWTRTDVADPGLSTSCQQ